MRKKCVAIIPARGGSKRIPHKNVKLFNGKPIISYAINTALSSKLFDKVCVSTDDETIATIAKDFGADVPFTRPASLSDDFCPLADVVEHALKFLKNNLKLNYSYCCMIYPTNPFSKKTYLKQGLTELIDKAADCAVSVATTPFPAHRCYKIDNYGALQPLWREYQNTRSQDLPQTYQDAGQFNWIDIKRFLASRTSPLGDNSFKTVPVILPRYNIQDIDNLEDWDIAERLYKINSCKG